LAIVHVGRDAGTVTLDAAAPGVSPATLHLTVKPAVPRASVP
jgi:hypothetical protein